MRKPAAIHIADTHLSESTLDINRKIYDQVARLAEDMGVPSIFHNGDIFTSRKGQSQIVLTTFKKIIDDYAHRNLMIYSIPGNHDKADLTSDESMCDVFDGHKAFTVVGMEKPMMSFKNIDVFFLPYYDEALKYAEKLAEVKKMVNPDRVSILITHVGINGVRSNGGVLVENNVTADMFTEFAYVLVGHYHDRQIVGERIVYTGSTHQANFGEDEHKGVVVIYDDAQNPIEFIDLDFPKYVTVDVIPDDLDKELLQMVKQKREEAFVRLRVAGDESMTEEQKKMVVEFQNAGAKVTIERASFTPVQIAASQDVTISSSDIIEAFDEWAKEKKIEDVKFGRAILQKVVV